jgi:hypothetical protein
MQSQRNGRYSVTAFITIITPKRKKEEGLLARTSPKKKYGWLGSNAVRADLTMQIPFWIMTRWVLSIVVLLLSQYSFDSEKNPHFILHTCRHYIFQARSTRIDERNEP